MEAHDIVGLVLSGGHGTRLRPITHTRAKQLIPVGNKPILYYGLEDLARAGIRTVGIVVGDTAEEIREAVGTGDAFGLDVTYIHQSEPLGLAHAVKIARDFLGNQPFLMYLGDNILKHGVASILNKFIEEKPAAHILLAETLHPERFGVAVIEEGNVIRLIEKPKVPPSHLALVGVYLFTPVIHEIIADLTPSARGEYEITDAIQGLIDRGGQVHYDIIRGWWKDTGQLEDLLEANRLVLEDITPSNDGEIIDSRCEGRVVIGQDSRVLRSRLRGPLVIGEHCTIQDAYIGPFTTLQDGVRVLNAEVEYSILLSGVEVLEIPNRIEGSLLGCSSRFIHSNRKPRTIQVMLGDNAWIDLP